MRHDATYEGLRAISRQEADELIAAVTELDELVREWLIAAHPDLQ
jgi:hypothetical protein